MIRSVVQKYFGVWEVVTGWRYKKRRAKNSFGGERWKVASSKSNLLYFSKTDSFSYYFGIFGQNHIPLTKFWGPEPHGLMGTTSLWCVFSQLGLSCLFDWWMSVYRNFEGHAVMTNCSPESWEFPSDPSPPLLQFPPWSVTGLHHNQVRGLEGSSQRVVIGSPPPPTYHCHSKCLLHAVYAVCLNLPFFCLHKKGGGELICIVIYTYPFRIFLMVLMATGWAGSHD